MGISLRLPPNRSTDESNPKSKLMSDIAGPETPVEQAIVDIWEETLGIDPIGREDRFTDLGGTSLGVEKVLAGLQRSLGRPLPASLFADDPTVAELGQAIDEFAAEEFGKSAPTATKMSEGPAAADGAPGVSGSSADSNPPENATTPGPVFMFAGAGASSVSFLPLSQMLAGRREAWAFHAHGFHSRGIADRTIAAHAKRHLPDIQRIQPTGAITVLGHSFGGHIAMEAARQLRAAGRDVEAIYLLDTVLPLADESVGDIVRDAPVAKPPLAQRLKTHWNMLTAGIARHDAATQQAIFWEHAIRAQNRVNLTGVPEGTTIFITDENANQVDRWSVLSPAPEIVRVPGTHLSPLNDAAVVAIIAQRLMNQ